MSLKELQDYIIKEGLHWTILGANDGWKTNEDGERVINTLIYYDAKTVMEFMQRKRVYAKDKSYIETVPDKIEIWKYGGYPDFEEVVVKPVIEVKPVLETKI